MAPRDATVRVYFKVALRLQAFQSILRPYDAGAHTMAPRKRHDDDDTLQRILAGYFTTPTHVGDYDDKRVDKHKIIKHKALMIQLRDLQPNLSFVASKMRKVVSQIANDNAETWRLTPAERQDFAHKAEKRVRAMCRHFAQALSKAKPPSWTRAVVDGHEQSSLEDARALHLTGACGA